MKEKWPTIKPSSGHELEILGEVGDFETPEGYPYSKINFIKELKELEKISDGGSYGEIWTTKIKTEDDQELLLAMKKNKENHYSEKLQIKETLKKYRILKENGLKTFDQMFVSKNRDAIFSTLLNKDKTIALSSNNDFPNIKHNYHENKEYRKKITENLKINNLEEIFKEFKNQAILASKNGLELSHDSLLYLVPEDFDKYKENGFNLDFIIGDLDIIKINQNGKNNLARNSLKELTKSMKSFIYRYVKEDEQKKYINILNEKLDPKLTNKEIFTKNGIKNINDYKKDDGEILKSNIEVNKNTTWEEIERLSSNEGLEIDLTEIRAEVKNKIKNWSGSITDDSITPQSYENLETIGGYFDSDCSSLSLPKLTTIGLDLKIIKTDIINIPKLKEVGGNLEAPYLNNFQAPNLKNIGENLDLKMVPSIFIPSLEKIKGNLSATMAKDFIADNLISVDGYLEVVNAKKFHTNSLVSVGLNIEADSAEDFYAPKLEEAKYINLSEKNFPDYYEYYHNKINKDLLELKLEKGGINGKVVLKKDIREYNTFIYSIL